jgi:energy-coupling factor transporter ATP-binding protein EcfA2
MRIIKFAAENIKKLRAVEITPTGHVVEITGPNGQGKSSVLDAIFYALAGTDGIPARVVRQGEEKASVRLELGDGGPKPELIVTRHFNAAGTTRLTVESADGAVFRSPQSVLDTLVGALSFDPLEFTRLKPREQLEALRRVVKLDTDLAELDQQTQRYFESRTGTNRDIKRLEAQLTAGLAPEEDTPDEPIDTGELAQRLQDAGQFNTSRQMYIRDRENLAIEIKSAQDTAKAHRLEATRIQKEAEERIEMQLACATHLEEKVKVREAHLATLAPVPEPVNTEEITAEIKRAHTVNAQVALNKARQKLEAELKLCREKAAQETAVIESNNKVRREVIARAPMPVPGLAFGEGEVLFNGLPLVNASSGEQLRVSVALAMAANPKLRILRVKDGSLLDEANLKLLTELAGLNDFQVWLERVEEAHGRPAVVMEDGRVAC